MRLTDDRYAGERSQFELALRMIRHEARTRTIRECTGLSDDRIRKLYSTYFRNTGATNIKRRRGKSPRQVTRFVKNPHNQLQATTLVALFCSGMLLRIGDDRFIPGLKTLVDTVREASGGHTRLFIQIIDFLAIRRRPDPARYFAQFLRITDRHRAALGAEDWPEDRVREHLAGLDDARLLLCGRRADVRAGRLDRRRCHGGGLRRRMSEERLGLLGILEGLL